MTPIAANRFLQILKSVTLIVLSLDFYFDVTQAGSNEASKHLDMGKQLLAAGNLLEALSQFDLAVEQDSKNYLTYFRRATVYLALGKSKSALPDLDKSIQLRPGFSAALIQRGNVYLKQGNLKAAERDFTEVYNNDKNNVEAMELLMSIQPLESDIETAKVLFQNQDYANVIELLSRPIELCPWNPVLKEIRSECFIALGDLYKASMDLRATTKLRNDNTAGLYKLSDIYYQMGEAEDALVSVKECLRLDQDHKQCFPFYKKTKKLVKQLKDAQEAINTEQWEDCVNKGKQILKTESESRVITFKLKGKSHICHCLAKAGHGKEALSACDEVLAWDPENYDAICDKAEAYIANEQYDEAIKDFQHAINIDQENRRAREGIERAQKLLKNSQKRDYYKILGVKRNAKKKQIIKAYRKLAVQWHPDKFEGEEEKKQAEKKFLDIAAAKEVLTDPEKRSKFDHGEDPLDPEQQQQGGNPFQGGFNPFGHGGGGGQGFNFKFHFN